MKIVIDIPDQKYKWIVDNPQVYTDDLCEVIRNGTPLPKHHGRLIDADALIDSLGASDRDIYCKAVIEEDAPTIIEESDTE